ncbi:HAMP domain-containing histidine kinase [Bacteroidia bacterium]|nr:HAMP domain-containing histidine kinase [Bacteroidia bacterium]
MRNEEDRNILNSYFDLQQKSIERLDTFIHKITSYSKNQRLPYKVTKLNFALIIDEILREHYFIANSDKIAKIVNIERNVDFLGDKERVSIILSNAISNAVKFIDLTKEVPQINIDVSMQNDNIKIVVEDNGLGIAKDYQSKVFDMFYKANKFADGSGIGLYILNEAVKNLKGFINLKSELGEFTQLSICLPN